jgi:hypothetical protein
VRAFAFGLLLLVVLTISVLSLRPGGLRRQLRYAARRLRIVLVLGGIYIAFSTVVGLLFPNGPLAEYGPPVLAVTLLVVFLVLGRDPASTAPPQR